jgi:hypothetical protein
MLLIFNPAYGPLANNAETLGYAGIAKSPANIEEKKLAENKLKFLESSLFKERAQIRYKMVIDMHGGQKQLKATISIKPGIHKIV